MAIRLTRSFKDLVRKRAAAEPAFAEALLSEGIGALLTGEVDVGRSLVRDYIIATVGFETLSEATGTDAKQPYSACRTDAAFGVPC